MRQFCAALAASISTEERRGLGVYLSSQEIALFEAMPAQDQRHVLDVFYELRDRGHADRDLLAAALLHDVGKAGAGLGTLFRTTIVLLRAISPRLLAAIAIEDARSWRHPFWVHRHHAEIGADLLAKAGTRDRVVELVRHHHNPPTEDLAAQALCDSDNRN